MTIDALDTSRHDAALPHADSTFPLVSVIVPCRNERRHIRDMLKSVLDSDYPKNQLEIIVADGMSNDGTRHILEQLASELPGLRVIDNPEILKPHALNTAIAAARGSVIVRMDAHTTYPTEYIRECVQALLEHRADNVGGVQAAVPESDSAVSQAICAFYSARLGLRRGRASPLNRVPRPAQTVYCGCFRRDVFERFGQFNTSLARGQDRELNARIIAGGGIVLLLPWVEAHYRPRTSLCAHAGYMFLAGMVPFTLQAKAGIRVLGLRNVIAAGGAMLILGLVAAASLWPAAIPYALALSAAYLLVTVASGACAAVENRSLNVGIVYPPIAWLSHSLYGLGAMFGAALLWTDRYFRPFFVRDSAKRNVDLKTQ